MVSNMRNNVFIAVFVPESLKLTGSESYSAERVRKFRKKQEALHCNTDVTACNEEKEIKKEIDYQLIADMYNDT